MPKHNYTTMDAAPKDGTPIIAVCSGVEMAIIWADYPFAGWYYFDEDDGGNTFETLPYQPTGWRAIGWAAP